MENNFNIKEIGNKGVIEIKLEEINFENYIKGVEKGLKERGYKITDRISNKTNKIFHLYYTK